MYSMKELYKEGDKVLDTFQQKELKFRSFTGYVVVDSGWIFMVKTNDQGWDMKIRDQDDYVLIMRKIV